MRDATAKAHSKKKMFRLFLAFALFVQSMGMAMAGPADASPLTQYDAFGSIICGTQNHSHNASNHPIATCCGTGCILNGITTQDFGQHDAILNLNMRDGERLALSHPQDEKHVLYRGPFRARPPPLQRF